MTEQEKTAIAIALLSDQQIKTWPFEDVRKLHNQIIESLDDARVWVAATKKVSK